MLAVIVAPTGELMHWARGETAEGAILSFLPSIKDWPYARSQGYRVKWFEPMRGPKEDGKTKYRGLS